MEVDSKRERNTGRYAYRDLEIPCRCGHTLGQHLAERAKCSDGITRQDCLENGCNCECFRKVGKKMENQTNKSTKKPESKPEIATPVVSSQRIDHQAQEPKLVTKMNPGIPDWLQWSADEEAMLTEEAAWILIPQIRAYIKSNEAEIQKLQGLVDKAKQLQLDLMPKLGFAAPSVAPVTTRAPKAAGTGERAPRTTKAEMERIVTAIKSAGKGLSNFSRADLLAAVEKNNAIAPKAMEVTKDQFAIAFNKVKADALKKIAGDKLDARYSWTNPAQR